MRELLKPKPAPPPIGAGHYPPGNRTSWPAPASAWGRALGVRGGAHRALEEKMENDKENRKRISRAVAAFVAAPSPHSAVEIARARAAVHGGGPWQYLPAGYTAEWRDGTPKMNAAVLWRGKHVILAGLGPSDYWFVECITK